MHVYNATGNCRSVLPEYLYIARSTNKLRNNTSEHYMTYTPQELHKYICIKMYIYTTVLDITTSEW